MSGPTAAHGDERDATVVAAAFARIWVRGYTSWVGTEAAERRRAEIASDLWEQRAEAREREATLAAALSIAGRVVAGLPADLIWVRTQRSAMRGQPANRKTLTMNTLGHIAARWWWVLGAAALAIIGIVALSIGGSELAWLQVLILVVLLGTGVAVRHSLPRTAGTLVVVGAAIPALLFWAPWLMVIGIVTLAGAAIEVVRLTRGSASRVLAVIGLAALAGGWVWVAGLGGNSPTDPGLLAPIIVALCGIAALIASGVRRRPVARA